MRFAFPDPIIAELLAIGTAEGISTLATVNSGIDALPGSRELGKRKKECVCRALALVREGVGAKLEM